MVNTKQVHVWIGNFKNLVMLYLFLECWQKEVYQGPQHNVSWEALATFSV